MAHGRHGRMLIRLIVRHYGNILWFVHNIIYNSVAPNNVYNSIQLILFNWYITNYISDVYVGTESMGSL